MGMGAFSQLSTGSWAPSDLEWQSIFQVSKLVSTLWMLVLLVTSVALASSIFGRVKALLWGMLCAISMGSVVEVYQLRNEFFSSFLFIAASLLSVVSVRASFAANKREQWHSRSWPLLGCLLVYLLFWVSFLAKVQIFPLFIIFNACFLVFVLRGFGLDILARVLLIALVVGLGAVCAAQSQGFQADLRGWWMALFVQLQVAVPAVAMLFCLASRRKGVIVLSAGCLTILAIAIVLASSLPGWTALIMNPLGVAKYSQGCPAAASQMLACVGRNSMDGIYYLFKRSIDGQFLALLVAIGMPLLVAASLWRAKRPSSLDPQAGCTVLLASVLIGSAFLMAAVAGQRWAVDHYLPYQHPFLFGGIIVMAGSANIFTLAWRSLQALILLGLILIFLRYPHDARKTYVKESLAVVVGCPDCHMSLCADQHRGEEWKRSSISKICLW